MTTTLHRRLYPSIGALAAVLIIASCGGSGSAATTSQAVPVSESGSATSPAVSVGESGAATAPAVPDGGSATTTSPDQSQGQGQGSDAAEFGLSEAEITKRIDAVELSIAQCMTDAGFEYLPVDYATVRLGMDSNSKPSGMTADEFRTQFGYGITTLSVTANAQTNIGLGRNIAIRDGLPTADKVAWNRQLLGEHPDQTFVVGLDNEDLSRTGGCTRTAVEENFSQVELGPSFVNYQSGDSARVDQDPRVIEANRNWAKCMRGAGFSYDDGTAIKLDLASRLATITGGADIKGLGAAAAASVVQLQGEELAIASADNKCNLDHVAAVMKKVETEILGSTGG